MTTRVSNESPPRLLSVGDTAWTIEFGETIDPGLHARVLGLADAIEERRAALCVTSALDEPSELRAIVDVVPTFRSVTVHFDPQRCDGDHLGEALLDLAATAEAKAAAGRCWRIPVCFDDEFAPDLDELAQARGMSREAVVELMTRTEFRVYMIGFMPGFPYMGGLPPELHMPRLASPRKAVPERSLAVANEMCAVYPWESPGGWRLLGRTPIPMFSATEAEPSLLASGDRVIWQAIDRDAYFGMEAAVKAGALDRRRLLIPTEGAQQ